MATFAGVLSAFGLRPVRPLGLAASNPAVVRSRMRSRSNSASAPIIWKISLPAFRRRIDFLGETDKIDTTLFQTGEEFNEMLERTTSPIQLPDDKGIPRSHIGQRLF